MRTYVYATLGALLLGAGAVALFVFFSPAPPRSGSSGTSGAPGGVSVAGPDAGGAGRRPSPPPEAPPARPTPAPGSAPSGGDSETGAPAGPAEDEEPDAVKPTLPLEEGFASLAVLAVERSGAPLPSVAVTLRAGREAERGITGVQGEVLFEGIAGGVYSLLVEATGRPPLVNARQVRLAPDEAKRIRLTIGEYDLAISGRVLDSSGSPVAGIEITASRFLFEAEEGTLVPWDQGDVAAVSAEDGSFEIRGLDEGEHQVRTVATPRYPPVEQLVRAGADAIDLVLGECREVTVTGVVTDASGAPIADARVIPIGQSTRAARTAPDGAYEIEVAACDDGAGPVIRFWSEEHRESLLDLPADPETGAVPDEVRLDARLEPRSAESEVVGLVRSPDGAPIAGETVHLSSQILKTHYQASSDAEGRFNLSGVQIGLDYRLWLRPRGPWQDHVLRPLEVTEAGLEVEVVLEPLRTGRLSGRFLDPGGAPLPGFSLWLRSSTAAGQAREVTSDAEGRFSVEDAPEGRLILETRALPRLTVSGLRLEPEEEKEVDVVLDVGGHELVGRIVDEGGLAVAGAEVFLSWVRRGEGYRSASSRKALADERGTFRFTQLGGGEHRVRAVSPGYRGAQETRDPSTESSEVLIRLQKSER